MNPTQKQFSLTGVSLNKANAYQYDLKLFNALRELRTQLAAKRGVPPFIILGDRALQEMSTYYPINLGDLLKINGFGEKKIND
ncbi:MAG TPA: HRDC domain-containing protein, partial [Sedimentisphaerales bacterium]